MFVDRGSDKNTLEFLKKSISSDKEEKQERTLKISGSPEMLDKLEKMIAYMERLGKIGHSTSFTVSVDGDGRFGVSTEDENGDSLSKKYLDEITNPQGKDIKSFSFD